MTTLTFNSPLPLSRIFKTWWPLAFSWLLMGLELPALSAIVARLAEPEINLAAYGGIVFPIALIVEAPIIMLLAASTALSKDWASYKLIRKFMMIAGAFLTALHIIIAFTPLYYLIVEKILGVPAEIVGPGRIGLMIMTPWTWAIAYRRFNQGVMIRFGHSNSVGVGTIVRLTADLIVLGFGYYIGSISGIVVATSAVIAGVICEAIYIGIRVRPIVRDELRVAPEVEPLTWSAFFKFYIPLAMTSLMLLIWQPIGSAALSRMPQALESLAVWPVVSGLIFMLRSMGVAYTEVVVALLDETFSYAPLKKFTGGLVLAASSLHILIAITPLSLIWFGDVSALKPELAEMARIAFLLAIPLPALQVLQSWFQGAIMHGRHTRGIPESVIVFLLTVALVFGTGIYFGSITGLYIGIVGFVIATFTQDVWLWLRSRQIIKSVQERDLGSIATPVVELV